MENIHVVYLGESTYLAYHADDPRYQAKSYSTVATAVGTLITTYPERFGINVVRPDDLEPVYHD